MREHESILTARKGDESLVSPGNLGCKKWNWGTKQHNPFPCLTCCCAHHRWLFCSKLGIRGPVLTWISKATSTPISTAITWFTAKFGRQWSPMLFFLSEHTQWCSYYHYHHHHQTLNLCQVPFICILCQGPDINWASSKWQLLCLYLNDVI